jgi:hypothetical protein
MEVLLLVCTDKVLAGAAKKMRFVFGGFSISMFSHTESTFLVKSEE